MPGVPTQIPPTNNPVLQGIQPWYTYPRIDNFGTQDPQAGTGWKPDSNIQIPGLYPITALLPMTVTSVQVTGFGQTVVTGKLDTPLNSLATHTFYEHMSSSTVGVGQHVNSGDLIGYNNPSGQVPLGFGLYSGDVYGSGPAYNILQNDLQPGGAGLLNPVNLLNQAQKGNLVPTMLGSYNQGIGNPLDAIGNFFSMLGGLFADPVRIIKGAIGLVLVLVGLVLMVKQLVPPEVAQAAKVVAMA